MALAPGEQNSDLQFRRPIRRILVAAAIFLLVGLFLLWRIENQRVEQFRYYIIDLLTPSIKIGLEPGQVIVNTIEAMQDLATVYTRNEELQREIDDLKAWKFKAQLLESQNAQFRNLANVQTSATHSFIISEILVDNSSQFGHSILINVGSRNGVRDGWPAIDSLGLVGRVSGVGRQSARVILLTDTNSRIPVKIQPSSARGIASGDASTFPILDLLSNGSKIESGDAVVTSGDGGMFPPDILVGTVSKPPNQILRIVPAADFRHLSYIKVLRVTPIEQIESAGGLVLNTESIDQLASGDLR